MARKQPDFLKRTKEVSSRMAAQDRQVEDRRSEERGDLNAVLLAQIKDRDVDTRPLTMKHVWALAESIAVLGLIEPLVIDQEKVLLAGGHRLAAIKIISEEPKYAEAYIAHFPEGRVPVRIMPFAASADQELALQVEVAENEQRRDYTPAEVRKLADRLMDAGYENVKGRPKRNQKALMPLLSSVVGKNRRTIQRYLEHRTSDKDTNPDSYLKKAKKLLEDCENQAPDDQGSGLLKEKLPEIIKLLEMAITHN